MLKHVFLACFEPVVACFGPRKIPKHQGQREVPAQSLPQTQHKKLGAQVHQHQQQNLREKFPSPEELLCQHDINLQAKHHIVRNHIHPKEGAKGQPTPRTTTPQEKGYPNKATGHIPRDNVQRAASNGVVANALDHTKIQRHHQANPPGHVLERPVPRWIIWL